MNVHAQEMISVLVFMAATFTLTAALVLRTGKGFSGSGRWILGAALASISFVLIALRYAIPDWISVGIANAMTLAGAIFILEGTRLFVGSRGPLLGFRAAAAACMAVILFFEYGAPNTGVRVIVMSLFMAGFGAMSAGTLLRRIPAECRFSRQWTAYAFAAYGATYLARAFLVWGSTELTTVFDDRAANPILAALLTASMLAWCAGFYLLSYERHRAELASQVPLPTTSKWCYTATDAAGPAVHRDAATL